MTYPVPVLGMLGEVFNLFSSVAVLFQFANQAIWDRTATILSPSRPGQRPTPLHATCGRFQW